jgi:signal transduction histidine kinase
VLKQLAIAVVGRESADGGRRWTPMTTDAVLAVLLTLLAQVELLLADVVEGPRAVQSLSFMAMTVAVAWRRSFPFWAAALAAVGLAVQTLAGDAEVVGGFLALAVVTYSVASYAPLAPAITGGVLILAAVFLYPFLRDVRFADEVGNGAIFIGTWGLGRLVRARQRRALTAQMQLEIAEREHEDRMRQILVEERTRIARELHDIVAHGVSLMVLQSGAARQTIDRDSAKAKELLATAEGQGRQALVEMQRMLGILRSPDTMTTEEPHTIASIGQLVEGLHDAGFVVDYRVDGDHRQLAAGMEVSAFRIVQEATTNIVKHAEANRVDIAIHYGADELTLVVHDDGRGASHPSHGSGHGLIGMKERASLFGGSLTAGPAEGGGWSVAASLPIDGHP